MTKESARTVKQVGTLKAALVTGSVIATLAGTYLLGLQEPEQSAVSLPSYDAVTVIIPAEERAVMQPPAYSSGTQIQLEPIPQVVQPKINPVARTRSSR